MSSNRSFTLTRHAMQNDRWIEWFCCAKYIHVHIGNFCCQIRSIRSKMQVSTVVSFFDSTYQQQHSQMEATSYKRSMCEDTECCNTPSYVLILKRNILCSLYKLLLTNRYVFIFMSFALIHLVLLKQRSYVIWSISQRASLKMHATKQ